jgi:hypothetical protein
MQVDQDLFRSILFETIDENPLASRAVLSLCSIHFTSDVPTLSVSLGKKSTLSVNLDFIQANCRTVEHVKTLLIHEFLHILLGHTLQIRELTPAVNIALDAVINAIIHRKFGHTYSSLMSEYYGSQTGLLALLRPLNSKENRRLENADDKSVPPPPLLDLHSRLYEGTTLAEDVLAIANSFGKRALNKALSSGRVLLGDHERETQTAEALGESEAKLFEQAIATVSDGVFRRPSLLGSSVPKLQTHERSIPAPVKWRQNTLPVLRRLLLPDPKSPLEFKRDGTSFLPVLNPSDRRGSLRALWNPLIPEIAWPTAQKKPAGTIQIYLDVSGSMHPFLEALVALLHGFYAQIRKPFWAFSTSVFPAQIINGRLNTKTTYGTSLACVFEHIQKTAPKKALIVTDGFVDYCSQRPKGEIEAIIPHDGCADVLQRIGIPVTRLTNLTAS